MYNMHYSKSVYNNIYADNSVGPTLNYNNNTILLSNIVVYFITHTMIYYHCRVALATAAVIAYANKIIM